MKKLYAICILLILYPSNMISQITEKKENKFSQAYGSHCGLYGNDPSLRLELDSLIKIKDWIIIENWMSSETLVKRVYSYDAIINIEELRQSISKKTEVQMNKLRKNKKKIWTCSGCSFETVRVKTIIERLENE